MKYTFLILASLISFATFAQKKPTKKSLPPPRILPPPPIVREKEQVQDIRNPFADEISFSWKNQPDTLTTITTKDIFEKTYTFRNYGKNVRVSTVYPGRDFKYKKPNKGEIEMAETLKINYKDYKNVTITGNTIKLISDDGNETVNLQFTKKGSQLVSLKETGLSEIFLVTKSYAGEPTIGL